MRLVALAPTHLRPRSISRCLGSCGRIGKCVLVVCTSVATCRMQRIGRGRCHFTTSYYSRM